MESGCIAGGIGIQVCASLRICWVLMRLPLW
jgi:hypothetical protein